MSCSTVCDADAFGRRDDSRDSRCDSTDEYSVQINNGVICIEGTQPGSVARVDCDSGYEPDPADQAFCGRNGEWSLSEIACSSTGNCVTPTVDRRGCLDVIQVAIRPSNTLSFAFIGAQNDISYYAILALKRHSRPS